jgi:glycopeptide antibiotics resistance protein
MISKLKVIVLFFFLCYISLLFYLLFFSAYRINVQGTIAYNILPFRTINAYIYHFEGFKFSMVTDNFFGNIAAFLPLGFLLPLLIKKLSLLKVISLSFFFSFLIEITQFLFRVGALDVDDMILNSLGGGIGYLLLVLLRILVSRKSW